jgi:hypothetical protein
MRSRYIYSPAGNLVAEFKGSECVFMDEKYYDNTPQTHYVMPDIQPYQSMADGSMITGRRQHREHLRQHNCIEIGNESMETRKAPPTDNRREVLRAQLANMTNSQADKILSKLREEARFTRR